MSTARVIEEIDVEIIRLPDVKKITGMGTTFIYTKAKAGKFPKQVKLGDAAVGWVKSEVQEWVKARRDARDQQA